MILYYIIISKLGIRALCAGRYAYMNVLLRHKNTYIMRVHVCVYTHEYAQVHITHHIHTTHPAQYIHLPIPRAHRLSQPPTNEYTQVHTTDHKIRRRSVYILPSLVLIVSLSLQPHKEYRFLYPTFPPLAMYAGVLLDTLSRRTPGKILSAFLISMHLVNGMSLVGLQMYVYMPHGRFARCVCVCVCVPCGFVCG